MLPELPRFRSLTTVQLGDAHTPLSGTIDSSLMTPSLMCFRRFSHTAPHRRPQFMMSCNAMGALDLCPRLTQTASDDELATLQNCLRLLPVRQQSD
jgi:hypothetical protein